MHGLVISNGSHLDVCTSAKCVVDVRTDLSRGLYLVPDAQTLFGKDFLADRHVLTPQQLYEYHIRVRCKHNTHCWVCDEKIKDFISQKKSSVVPKFERWYRDKLGVLFCAIQLQDILEVFWVDDEYVMNVSVPKDMEDIVKRGLGFCEEY